MEKRNPENPLTKKWIKFSSLLDQAFWMASEMGYLRTQSLRREIFASGNFLGPGLTRSRSPTPFTFAFPLTLSIEETGVIEEEEGLWISRMLIVCNEEDGEDGEEDEEDEEDEEEEEVRLSSISKALIVCSEGINSRFSIGGLTEIIGKRGLISSPS